MSVAKFCSLPHLTGKYRCQLLLHACWRCLLFSAMPASSAEGIAKRKVGRPTIGWKDMIKQHASAVCSHSDLGSVTSQVAGEQCQGVSVCPPMPAQSFPKGTAPVQPEDSTLASHASPASQVDDAAVATLMGLAASVKQSSTPLEGQVRHRFSRCARTAALALGCELLHVMRSNAHFCGEIDKGSLSKLARSPSRRGPMHT